MNKGLGGRVFEEIRKGLGIVGVKRWGMRRFWVVLEGSWEISFRGFVLEKEGKEGGFLSFSLENRLKWDTFS